MFFKLDAFSKNLISIGFLFSAIAIILLPNGLINLGFLMILIGFLANSKTYKLNTWIDLPRPFWLMILFFVWVLASFLWSHADSLDSIEHLRKARVFLFIPIFFIALNYLDSSKVLMTKDLLFLALSINVLIVYLNYIGLYDLPGESKSLKLRIYFGLTTAFFFFWSMNLYFQEGKKNKYLYVLYSIASFAAIVFIEDGRTGYALLGLMGLFFLIPLIRHNFKIVVLILVLTSSALILASKIDGPFANRLDDVKHVLTAIINTEEGAELKGKEIRLEWIKRGLEVGSEQPLHGYGIGSYKSVAHYPDVNPLSLWNASHPHSSLTLIFVQYGFIGISLFLVFLGSLYFASAPNLYGRLLKGVVVLSVGASMINSSFFDMNDSHFLVFILVVMSALGLDTKNILK